jgi:hypothetical protein
MYVELMQSQRLAEIGTSSTKWIQSFVKFKQYGEDMNLEVP